MGAPVDSSVIVPCSGDAAVRAGGEATVFHHGGRLATVCRWTIQGGFNGVDRVAVAIDVIHKVDGIVQCVFHHVNGDEISSVGQGELKVTHGVHCFDFLRIHEIGDHMGSGGHLDDWHKV